jgi:hypothetical protein
VQFIADIEASIGCDIKKKNNILDEELNQRAWDRYNSEDHSNESYGVHREHGWYLLNDD